MKFDDLINGILFLVLGVAIAIYAQTLPTMAHIDYGPALLPTIVGVGMALAGATLIVRRLWLSDGHVGGWISFSGTGKNGAIGFSLFVGSILVYALLADWLGFLLIAPVLLFVLVYWFERRWKLALGVALIGTLLLHSFFYQIMKAPLPWGLLEAWSGVLTW